MFWLRAGRSGSNGFDQAPSGRFLFEKIALRSAGDYQVYGVLSIVRREYHHRDVGSLLPDCEITGWSAALRQPKIQQYHVEVSLPQTFDAFH